MLCGDAVPSAAVAASSSDDVMEPRSAARPSGFVQQLQSHVVDVPPSSSCDLADVDDDAPSQLTRPGSPPSPSTSHRDPRPVSVAVDDVTLGARPDDGTPTSSPLANDLCPVPPSPTRTQQDPAAVFVVPPLSSLLAVGAAAADRRKSTAGDGDDVDADASCRRPLSSGWATALAAATIAGKAAAATAIKRRPNAAKPGGASLNIRASRSLFCLTTSNPIRKLSISVVEWKYPLRPSSVYNSILRRISNKSILQVNEHFDTF